MHHEGKISDKVYKKALKTKLKLVSEKNNSESEKPEDKDILSWYDEYVIDQVIADLQSKYDYEYNEAWRMVYYGGLSIYSAVDLNVQKWVEDVYENRSGFPYASKDSHDSYPQSSMTIMDYKGRIVALAGGADKKTTNRSYNRATDNRAKRQPGSSIKPLAVYAPAIDQGLITPSSSILEKAIIVDGEEWPRNFNGDHGSGSYVSVENALVRSLNTVPVRILKEQLGTKASLKYCNERFHLNFTAQDEGLSQMAVGGTYTGVTTLEMAAAFAAFGNGGKYYKPYSYYKVLDRNGEVILENTANEPEQAISYETSQSMLGMLTKAVTQSIGTGYGSKISRFQTFAKTGTTSDNSDKWYCGGTPYYVAAVWYGYDYRANLYTGSSNPAKTIFRYVFSELHEDLPDKTFDDVIEDIGDVQTGKKNKITIDTDVTADRSDEITNEQTTTEPETTAEPKTTKSEPEKDTTKKPAPSTTKSTTQPKTEPTTKKPEEPSVEQTDPPTQAPTDPPTHAPTEPEEPTEDIPVID